jgi:rare lipoprotein A (peptidoglycan hydrolase)
MLTFLSACRLLLLTFSTTPFVIRDVATDVAAEVTTEVGRAAVFGYEGDKWAGGPLACTGKTLQKGQAVCAHRTIPCGTRLLLQNLSNHRIATCRVLDRGPFGARLPGGGFVLKRNAHAKGTWQGVVDMSPPVAARLGMSRSVAQVRLLFLNRLRRSQGRQKEPVDR